MLVSVNLVKVLYRAFADSKSWDGNFSLRDFKVINGHVRVITSARGRLTSNSMNADFVSSLYKDNFLQEQAKLGFKFFALSGTLNYFHRIDEIPSLDS